MATLMSGFRDMMRESTEQINRNNAQVLNAVLDHAQQQQTAAAVAAATAQAQQPSTYQFSTGNENLKSLAYLKNHIPIFHGQPGEDLENWINGAEIAFTLYAIAEDLKVRAVIPHLKDLAYTWFMMEYRRLEQARTVHPQRYTSQELLDNLNNDSPLLLNWDALVKAMRRNFQPENYQEQLFISLQRIRHQLGHVQEYIHQFQTIAAQVTTLTEEGKVTLFKQHLDPKIQKIVVFANPRTLLETYRAAQRAEQTQTSHHVLVPAMSTPLAPPPYASTTAPAAGPIAAAPAAPPVAIPTAMDLDSLYGRPKPQYRSTYGPRLPAALETNAWQDHKYEKSKFEFRHAQDNDSDANTDDEEVNNALYAAMTRRRNQKPTKGLCHFCKKPGHFIRECWKRRQDIKDGKVKKWDRKKDEQFNARYHCYTEEYEWAQEDWEEGENGQVVAREGGGGEFHVLKGKDSEYNAMFHYLMETAEELYASASPLYLELLQEQQQQAAAIPLPLPLGNADKDYAHELVTRSTENNPRITWQGTAQSVNGKTAPAQYFYDCGASGMDFISESFVKKNDFQTFEVPSTLTVEVGDDRKLKVNKRALFVIRFADGYEEKIIATVLPSTTADIVLSHNWAKCHHAKVDSAPDYNSLTFLNVDTKKWHSIVVPTIRTKEQLYHNQVKTEPQHIAQPEFISAKAFARLLQTHPEQCFAACRYGDSTTTNAQLHSAKTAAGTSLSTDALDLNQVPTYLRTAFEGRQPLFDDFNTPTPLDDYAVHIKTTDEEPITSTPRRLSPAEDEELRAQLEMYAKAGFIQEAPSDCEWASPILFAKKPGGGLRLCVDYRLLNKKTIRDRFPLPHIDDALNRLAKAKVFTALDQQKAFNRLRMHPDSVNKTAFTTPRGHFVAILAQLWAVDSR